MKLLSAEVDLGSANNISKSPIVRIYNSDSSAVVLTRKNNVETTLGSYTIPPGKVIYCHKAHTDTLEGGAALKATGIGYSEMLDIVSVGGSAYSDGDIVTTNLIYHLDANNSSSYSGSGGTWTDLVAGTNNATIVNGEGGSGGTGPTYTEGTGDQGFYFAFDGIDDYVELDQNAFDLGTSWTVEIWCRHDSDSESSSGTPYVGSTPAINNAVVFSTQKGFSSSNALKIGKKNTLYSGQTAGYLGTLTITDTPLQTWRQIVITKTSGTASNYIRGYLNGSYTGHGNINVLDDWVTDDGNPSIIGANATNALQAWWTGQVSIFRVYSSVLSATEIETNYDANKGRYGLS